jgi:hypothetical protein
MDTVKKSVWFPFSCGQCHCRSRRELIKDQENGTVIEKGRYVTQTHTGFYRVPEKHTTVYLIKTLRVQSAEELREGNNKLEITREGNWDGETFLRQIILFWAQYTQYIS